MLDLEVEGKSLADGIQIFPEGLLFGRVHRTVLGNCTGHNGKTLNPLAELMDGHRLFSVSTVCGSMPHLDIFLPGNR